MKSWIEGQRPHCGPLTDAALAFGARLGVERDPPSGARGLLLLGRAIERRVRDANQASDEVGERAFIEHAGAFLALLLRHELGDGRHEQRADRHLLRFGEGGWFDPFAAIERSLDARDVCRELAEHVALAERLVHDASPAAAERAFELVAPRILPRLVGAAFFERLAQAGAQNALCRVAIAGELEVCFVLQEPARSRFVQQRELEAWRCDVATLQRWALRNLAERSARARLVRVEGAHGARVVAQSGDGLDAARLLLPGLYDVLAAELGSPFAAAVPHRDALLACRADSSAALSALREDAERSAERARYPITRQLIAVGSGGRLALLEA